MRHIDITNSKLDQSLGANNSSNAMLGIMSIVQSINRISNRDGFYGKDLIDLSNEIPHEIERCAGFLKPDAPMATTVGEMRSFLLKAIDGLKGVTNDDKESAEFKLNKHIKDIEGQVSGGQGHEKNNLVIQIKELQAALSNYVKDKRSELTKKDAERRGDAIKEFFKQSAAVAEKLANERKDDAIGGMGEAKKSAGELVGLTDELQKIGQPGVVVKSDNVDKEVVRIVSKTLQANQSMLKLQEKYKDITNKYITSQQQEKVEQQKLITESTHHVESLDAQIIAAEASLPKLEDAVKIVRQKMAQLERSLAHENITENKQAVDDKRLELDQATNQLNTLKKEIIDLKQQNKLQKRNRKQAENHIKAIDHQLELAMQRKILVEQISSPTFSTDDSNIFNKDGTINAEKLNTLTSKADKLNNSADQLIQVLSGQITADISPANPNDGLNRLNLDIYQEANLYSGGMPGKKKDPEFFKPQAGACKEHAGITRADDEFMQEILNHDTNQAAFQQAVLAVNLGRVEAKIKQELGMNEGGLLLDNAQTFNASCDESRANIRRIIEENQAESLAAAKEAWKSYIEELVKSENTNAPYVKQLKEELHKALDKLDLSSRAEILEWVFNDPTVGPNMHYILGKEKLVTQISVVSSSKEALQYFVGDIESGYQNKLDESKRIATNLSAPVANVFKSNSTNKESVDTAMRLLNNDLEHLILPEIGKMLSGIYDAQRHNCPGIPSFF